jgi:hypothetical protein
MQGHADQSPIGHADPETGSLSEESWSMESTKKSWGKSGRTTQRRRSSEENENRGREGDSRHRKHRTREASDLGENQNSGKGQHTW